MIKLDHYEGIHMSIPMMKNNDVGRENVKYFTLNDPYVSKSNVSFMLETEIKICWVSSR